MQSRKRPFWLLASNYYVLVFAVTAAFFFVAWGVLNEAGDETPWISAGIAASGILAGAVVLREVVLRRVQLRAEASERVLKRLHGDIDLRARIEELRLERKVTAEQNAILIDGIRSRSQAAFLLSKVSAGHREVFEICEDYLALTERDLHSIAPNSPRLAPLLRGRTRVADLHRRHMLKWAEIEATTLLGEANTAGDIERRTSAANRAVAVIDKALGRYPGEADLLGSRELLVDLEVSIRVSDIIERAEQAALLGEIDAAIASYREALAILSGVAGASSDREEAARQIMSEIEHLSGLERR